MESKKTRKRTFTKKDILKTQGVLFDVELLSIIEKAEKGDCTAMRILAGKFFSNTGAFVLEKFSIDLWAKPNLEIARYYGEQIIKMHEQGTIDDADLYVYDLKIMACIEGEDRNYEKSQSYFIRATHYMANELPPDKWDYDIFRLMHYSLYHFGYITKEEFEDTKW